MGIENSKQQQGGREDGGLWVFTQKRSCKQAKRR